MNKIKLFFFLATFFFNQLAIGQKTLHLYGGEKHDVYLGCINCNEIDPNSIWNNIGLYGSTVSSTSIWNSIGIYGNDISRYSPFNSIASYPPAILDKDGNFYGYLIANSINIKRADFKLAETICKYYQDIQRDVTGWYKKLFN